MEAIHEIVRRNATPSSKTDISKPFLQKIEMDGFFVARMVKGNSNKQTAESQIIAIPGLTEPAVLDTGESSLWISIF